MFGCSRLARCKQLLRLQISWSGLAGFNKLPYLQTLSSPSSPNSLLPPKSGAMSLDGNQSLEYVLFSIQSYAFQLLTGFRSHEQDDKESWRWSTETVASILLDTSGPDESTDSSMAPMPHKITAEILSCIPIGYNKLEASVASSSGADFLERQVKRDQEEEHLNTKHASAVAVSLQQYFDIIGQDHTQVDLQAEMLVGLQMHMEADPPTGTPADLRADLAPSCRPGSPAVPAIAVDDDYDDTTFAAYATAYQLRPPGTTQLDSGVRNTMRREAAMDDAIFQPLRLTSRKTLIERRIATEDAGAVTVHRNVRKRKRETKDTD